MKTRTGKLRTLYTNCLAACQKAFGAVREARLYLPLSLGISALATLWSLASAIGVLVVDGSIETPSGSSSLRIPVTWSPSRKGAGDPDNDIMCFRESSLSFARPRPRATGQLPRDKASRCG